MSDWPFVSYPTDPYVDPTTAQTFLFPAMRGERCASYRPDLTPRGLYIQYAGQTSPRGTTIVQGPPLEANVYGGNPGFGGPPSTAVGPKLAGTGANGSGGLSNVIWTNPSNVASTALYATASFPTAASSGGSGYAYATNFRFSIPLNFAIVGINCIGVAYTDASADFVGLQLQILKNGQPVGNPKTISISSSAAAFNVGGNGDLWGVPGGLLASDVNTQNFGVAIAGVYQNSQNSGTHNWGVNSINFLIYAADPSNINPSVNTLSGVFSLPYGSGMQIAQWTANSAGVLESIVDVRPSGTAGMPMINGFVEIVNDDPAMMRTLDNSFHIRADHLQPTGKVYVGAGQIRLPNSTVVTWNGAGPPNYFYQGPFVRNGVIAGKQAVIGRSGLADAVAGIVQVFIDNTGAITWNDAPAPPTPVTTFPSNVFPLSVISVDSACRVFDVIDARTFLSF